MPNEPPPPASTRIGDEGAPDRLDSWKDIAAYLKRDVSTVQRWEKRERMPVHRHVHDKLGTVYGFRPELDAWWRGRGSSLASATPGTLDAVEDSQPHVPLDPGDEANPGRVRWTRRWLLLAGLVALGLLVTIAYVSPFGRAGDGTKSDIAARGTLAEQARPGKPRPVNPEAYESLLRARYLSVRTTDRDSQAAIALLERAVAVDPEFAPAYAELAAAHVVRLTFVAPEETGELEQKAFAAAEKALSLDPDLPEAYLARGDLLWTHSHHFAHERAAQEFRRALSLNPNSDGAHRRLARVYAHVGFFEEALQHAATALTINPSNAQALNTRAQALLWMGKDEEALATFLSIPGPVLPELVEANTVFTLLRLGRREEASFHLEAALRKYPNDKGGNLAGIEAMRLAESQPVKAAAFIETVARRKSVNPAHHAAYFAACASARMRRAKEAVDWLREAAETGFPCYALFARDPNLDPIRADPGFQAFMTDLQKRSASLRKAMFPDRK
jgi:tetratricopeptide (TPR) repeat protein